MPRARQLMDELGLEPSTRAEAAGAGDPHSRRRRAGADGARRALSALPAPTTRTIGRDGDRDAVSHLLRQDGVRLVTLTGLGGVGKTRLALEVARELEPELPDGAWFVSLAATARPEHVASTIAQAIQVTSLEGESPQQALERFLAPKRGLLVLDNFEHLLPAAPLVSALLAKCGALKVLATSRAALRLQPERRFPVEPLSLPAGEEPAEVAGSAAGALFLSAPAAAVRSLPSTCRRPARSRSCAGGWMACRWRSSSPLPAPLCSSPASLSPDSRMRSTPWGPARGTPRSASAPWGRRSIGATGC